MAGAAPQVPPALPERLQRALVHAAARPRARDAADRRRRRAARASGPARARILLHPAERIDLVLDFSAYGPGERARALQRATAPAAPGRSCASTSRAAAAARSSRCRRGCASPSRCPAPTRAGAGSSRSAPRRGRSTGSASTRTGSTRGPGVGQHGDLDVRQPLQPRAPDAPPRLPVPRARALQRARRAADRLGWKDTVGVLPNETVSVLAWFAPYAGSTSSTATRSSTPTRR